MKGCTHGLHLGVQSSYVSSFPSAPQDSTRGTGPTAATRQRVSLSHLEHHLGDSLSHLPHC